MPADHDLVPNLLVIGAMKSGTRSFYELLRRSAGAEVTAAHEPDVLVQAVDRADAVRAWGRQFTPRAIHAAVRADLSTSYAKRPTVDGVAERARRWLGDDTHVLYLVRDPIARMRSQVGHQLATGSIGVAPWRDILASHPEVADYSRYRFQLEPWSDAFGGRVGVVAFDDLVSRTRSTIDAINAFLGSDAVDRVDQLPRMNEGGDVRRLPGWLAGASTSRLYRRHVRPRIPDAVVGRARTAVGRTVAMPVDDFDPAAFPDLAAELTAEYAWVLNSSARVAP